MENDKKKSLRKRMSVDQSHLLKEQGVQEEARKQFEKHPLQLTYLRVDMEREFKQFYCDMFSPSLRASLFTALCLILLKFCIILFITAADRKYFIGGQGYLIGFSLTGLLVGFIVTVIGLALTFNLNLFLRYHRLANALIFLFLGLGPIVTANYFNNLMLSETVIVELYLLMFVYAQYARLQFVESVFCGWALFLYYVGAIGLARNQLPFRFCEISENWRDYQLEHLSALILYSCLGTLFFNKICFSSEQQSRATFEVYMLKRLETRRLLVEIDDLKKSNTETNHQAPPDAPLTKALKLLRQMELTDADLLPPHLLPTVREVVEILSSSKLYAPNVRKAVGDEEIGNWLDSMLGENNTKGVVRGSLDKSRRGSYESLDLPTVDAKRFADISKAALNINVNLQSQIFEVLSKVNTWDFDVFELAKLTNGHPLLYLGQYIFQEEQFLFKYQIPDDTLLAYLAGVESGYVSTNPYHNSIHAADVLHACYYFMKQAFKKGVIGDLEMLSCLVAACVHDYAHPGVNNSFLVKIEHPIATRYNDRSVLENFHASESFKLLKIPELNILANLTKQQMSLAKTMINDLILSTDVSQHFEHVGKFENKAAAGMEPDDLSQKENLNIVLTMIIKCGDMSNPTKNEKLNREWVNRIMEEFYMQGDMEKEKGLDISMFYDRSKPNVPKCQTGFTDFFVRPMYAKWRNFLQNDAVQVTVDYLEANYSYWKLMLDKSQTLNASSSKIIKKMLSKEQEDDDELEKVELKMDN